MKAKDLLVFLFVDTLILSIIPFIFLFIAGLVLVPMALLFGLYEEKPSNRDEYKGWKMIQPYKFFKPWANEVGWLGDGTWPNNVPFGLNTHSKLAMFLWTIRNPLGGWDRYVGFRLEADDKITYQGDKYVGDDSGNAGWHLVRTETPNKVYMGFYLVWQLPFNKAKCLRVRIGYKVKPTYVGLTRDIDTTPLSVTIKDFKKN